MTLDATLRPTALRLITKYGKTVTFSRTTANDYDPTTGQNTLTTEDVTVKAVIDKYSALEKATGAVQSSDVKLTIADIDPAPTTSDTFTIDGVAHQVVDVGPVYTGELVGIWEIQARRA